MTQMPKLSRQAPGYYVGQIEDADRVAFVTIEHTDIETREMFGQHGWFWKLDGAFGREQSDCVFSSKRDAEASLRSNWGAICGSEE